MAGIRNLPREADKPSLFLGNQTELFSVISLYLAAIFSSHSAPSILVTCFDPDWLAATGSLLVFLLSLLSFLPFISKILIS